jgi:methylmalonyl-CoA mutase N-terminal domain/subunit
MSKLHWNDKVAKQIAMAPESKQEFPTSSNLEMERRCTPGFDYPGYQEQLGFPGAYLYIRAVQPTRYRKPRQYAGFGAAHSMQRALPPSQTSLTAPLDLPTQTGYDSDAALSRGEVG